MGKDECGMNQLRIGRPKRIENGKWKIENWK
jgi:hypothetical protein